MNGRGSTIRLVALLVAGLFLAAAVLPCFAGLSPLGVTGILADGLVLSPPGACRDTSDPLLSARVSSPAIPASPSRGPPA